MFNVGDIVKHTTTGREYEVQQAHPWASYPSYDGCNTLVISTDGTSATPWGVETYNLELVSQKVLTNTH